MRCCNPASATALVADRAGVDVLEGPAGPVVVDVNPVPSCRRVPGAARSIAEHLLALCT
ncbi:MAG: hypothetical protein M3493_11150 [Actinomycetota bacterium]|nr:hypothetical protein [Actinomycetota bacterium]